jgi:hypothetical protein
VEQSYSFVLTVVEVSSVLLLSQFSFHSHKQERAIKVIIGTEVFSEKLPRVQRVSVGDRLPERAYAYAFGLSAQSDPAPGGVE